MFVELELYRTAVEAGVGFAGWLVHVDGCNIQQPTAEFERGSNHLNVTDDLNELSFHTHGITEGGSDHASFAGGRNGGGVFRIPQPHLVAGIAMANADLRKTVAEGRDVRHGQVECAIVGAKGEV